MYWVALVVDLYDAGSASARTVGLIGTYRRKEATTFHLVASLNKGTPIWTPKYFNSFYNDPKKGTPNFGILPLCFYPKPSTSEFLQVDSTCGFSLGAVLDILQNVTVLVSSATRSFTLRVGYF